MAQPADFSEATAKLIDEEIRNIIDRMEEKAEGLLKNHRKQLDALANALLKNESLDAGQIREVLEGVKKS